MPRRRQVPRGGDFPGEAVEAAERRRATVLLQLFVERLLRDKAHPQHGPDAAGRGRAEVGKHKSIDRNTTVTPSALLLFS